MPEFYPCAKTQRPALLKSLFVFALLLSSHFLFSQPVINSFSPVSGPVGTTVTITGSNFSTTAADNIVFFGAVKAPVTAATSTALTVTVPTGATYQPITVTTNGLTGYALKPFNITFPLSGPLSTESFPDRSDLATNNFPNFVILNDVDDDGKPDLIVLNASSLNFSIYKNNSTAGNISFLPKTNYNLGSKPNGIALGDLDGDGKKDMIITTTALTSTENPTFILKNTSTPGNISFAEKTVLVTWQSFYAVHINDMNADGKPEVLFCDPGSKSIWVYKNTSINGVISFASYVNFPTGGKAPWRLSTGDMDGDDKPDIIAADLTSPNFTVLLNTTSTGTLSFVASGTTSFPDAPYELATEDIDNDGKKDVIVATALTNKVSVYRNTSTTGNVSFGPATNFTTAEMPYRISINDLDGDGKPDMAIPCYNDDSLSILINTSTPGSISFKPKFDLKTGLNPGYIQTGDMDGDTRPDIVVTNVNSYTLSIFRNKSEPVISYFSPTSGTAITIIGKHLGAATSVSIGGIPVTSFTVVSSTTITAVVATGSKGIVSVTTPIGTASLDGFGLNPTITSFSPASAPVGATVTITGTNFSSTASDNIVYFGTVKANVLSSSATTLTVKVPVGAAYQPISVTTNKLTAYSAVPYNVTFPGIGATFAANSFSAGVNHISGNMPYDACIGDIDGDGKIDVIAANYGGNNVSVFRNTSINGSISFATKVDFSADYPYNIATGDIDGDGKLDIVTSSSSAITVLRNTSTPGNISFTNMGTFDHNNGVIEFIITDLDLDGKPDIALAGTNLAIMKNTSSANAISFGAPVYFIVKNYQCVGISAGDLDGDGKPDIAITGTVSAVDHTGWFSMFRNTMVSGAPFSSTSFAPKIDVATNATSTDVIRITDVDADGKQDILAGNTGSGTLYVYKNTSTTGNISLATRISYNTGTNVTYISVDDLDGDGKPDVIVPIRYQRLGLFKNTGTTGAVSLAPIVKYDNTGEPYNSTSGDLDGDGKPDLVIANYSGDGFTVYRNQVAEPTVSPIGSSPVNGNIVTKLAVDGSVQLYNNTPYVQRHYDILPDNNAASATATVTLYFTQQEFNNFNAMANHGADLPTAPTDATGIANLRIYQYHGTSTTGLPGSYTGSAVAIDPVDTKIVWNTTTEWWEVTFDITGFSGFFASNATFNYVAPTAPVITAGSATTFCAGGSVTLSSSATSGNQWYRNSSPVNNATGATLTVTTSGTYAVTATTNGVMSALSQGVVVTVNAAPAKPTITRNASQLVSSASSGNQWYKDGAIINAANTSTFTPNEAGNYSVIVTENGCTSPESDKFNYTVTGVVNLDNNQFIRLSPNPVKDNMLLVYEMRGTTSLTIQIIDINGRICKTFTNKGTGSQLSLADLNNGVYIANIFTSNQKQRYTIRLIKH